MKIQDIVFFIILIILIWKHNPWWFVVVGLLCLLISIPLFALWIFFTAQRLVEYAAAFFLFGIIFYMIEVRRKKRNDR